MTEEFENKDDKGSKTQISAAEGTDYLDGAWRTSASEGKEDGQDSRCKKTPPQNGTAGSQCRQSVSGNYPWRAKG